MKKSTIKVRGEGRITPQYCKDDCSNLQNGWWVGCKYSKKFLSLQKCLIKLGVYGGDWFHPSCVGLTKKHKKKERRVCRPYIEKHPEEISRRAKQKLIVKAQNVRYYPD